MKKRDRCKDCRWYRTYLIRPACVWFGLWEKSITPGQFACKKFVPRKEKGEDDG